MQLTNGHALEQINRDLKVQGGVIGISVIRMTELQEILRYKLNIKLVTKDMINKRA